MNGNKSNCEIKVFLAETYNKETENLAKELTNEVNIDYVIVDMEKFKHVVFYIKIANISKQDFAAWLIGKYQGKFIDFEFLS